MLHAVQPSSCDGTALPESSCSPAMWVALGMCPLFHSDSHRLRDKIDVVCSWRPRGGLGLRQAGSVHVHHDRKEAVVELLVEVLHLERRVGAEDRRAERKQHLASLLLGLDLYHSALNLAAELSAASQRSTSTALANRSRCAGKRAVLAADVYFGQNCALAGFAPAH